MDYNKTVSDIENIKHVQLTTEKYCITKLIEDLEWLAKTASFSKSFSDYLVYVNKSNTNVFLNCPIDVTSNYDFDIIEKTPFLKYKEEVKCKYRNIVYVLKHLYKTALKLPDAERVIHTITTDFDIKNDIYLKHPDFIIDHFIYHTYCHNHISDNYEKVLNIIKVFEYLYYKTINYVAELEFESETNVQPCYIDRSYT
jgi:hypothetical protein